MVCLLNWKMKWILSIVVVLSILVLSKLEEVNVISAPLSEYVTTGKDFLVMKKWVASILNESESDRIVVNYEESKLMSYESMQPYKEGVLVSYTQPVPVIAQEDGLVIFTGITRQTGKTLAVLYDNGDEVTYGFVGSFSKLPYSSIKKGDTLALMDEEPLFLMVKRDGVNLAASLLPAYMSGLSE